MPPVNAVAAPPAVAQEMSNEWWLVQTTNGAIGLIKGKPPTNAISSIFIASADNIAGLENNHAQAVGNALGKLGSFHGVSQNQLNVLNTQIDHGAGLSSDLSWLYIGSDADKNSVSSNVSTSLGSEADSSNIIPSPSISGLSVTGAISDIWGWLTTASNWVRILEYVGGAALIYMGLKGLTGIEAGPGGAM